MSLSTRSLNKFLISSAWSTRIVDVSEVLNVNVNESKKKIYLEIFFFSSSEKLIFEKENRIF